VQGDRVGRQAAAEAGGHGHQVDLDAVGVLHEQAPVPDPTPVGEPVVQRVHDHSESGQHRGQVLQGSRPGRLGDAKGEVEVGVGVADAAGDRAAQLQPAPARVGLDDGDQPAEQGGVGGQVGREPFQEGGGRGVHAARLWHPHCALRAPA
jgi:hypothetical protein